MSAKTAPYGIIIGSNFMKALGIPLKAAGTLIADNNAMVTIYFANNQSPLLQEVEARQ